MLIYLLMFDDYYERHGRDQLVSELQPCVSRLLNYLLSHMENGLLSLPGWNFIDWCEEWKQGIPPGSSPNSIMNWLFVQVLEKMARRNVRSGLLECAGRLRQEIHSRYYNPSKGLYAIDLNQKYYSEHSQVLALLVDPYAPVIDGLKKYKLPECSIYFSFYYFPFLVRIFLSDPTTPELP